MSIGVRDAVATPREPGSLERWAAAVRRVVVLAVIVCAVALAALDAFDQQYGAQSTFGRCSPSCLDLEPAGDEPPVAPSR